MNDPISDALTRLRNGLAAKRERVDLRASKLIREVVKILKSEGYIKNFRYVDDKKQGIIRVYLKYAEDGPVMTELTRLSRPGRRLYKGKEEVPVYKNGLGTVIVSTSHGVLTAKKARKMGVGGEILLRVF